MKNTVLFIEDEAALRRLLMQMVQREGHNALGAATGSAGLTLAGEHDVDVVVLDMMLPDTTGLDVLRRLRSENPLLPVIILTAYGEVETVVAAVKGGAFDYVSKPADYEELRLRIRRALEWRSLQLELSFLKDNQRVDLHGASGESQSMRRVFELVQKVAPTPATVLLTGETGTGKSLVARAIHNESGRRERPFIALNCAAIPETLLESELFGYRKGAFTGATETRPGKFEAADGGTIFLDEIGELPLSLQAKLLQVVQDRTFMRLGSTDLRSVDVRVISATNRVLADLVADGRFREDLLYRLNVVTIPMPALRSRLEDLPILCAAIIRKLNVRLGKALSLTSDALELMRSYRWPGNVRELENVLERAALLCPNDVIDVTDLPEQIAEGETAVPPSGAGKDRRSLPTLVDELERSTIAAAVSEAGGNQAKAAIRLGISRQRLLYKMKRLGLA